MNRSNICPTDSSSSNERDKRSDSHINSQSPLSDICKYLDVPKNKKASPKENVELALEVEINESLKEVLERDSSGSSDLLDVTIIRPSESDTTHETTVALNKEEVRDFISLVEQHHKNKNEVRNRIKSGVQDHRYRDVNDAREETHLLGNDNLSKKNPISRSSSSRSTFPNKAYGTRENTKLQQHISEGVYDTKTVQSHKISSDPKQVYATVNNFDKLKTQLRCQNKHKHDDQKPGTPCLCQHCGIVGVLVQSQKGPVAGFPAIDEEEYSEEQLVTRRPKSRGATVSQDPPKPKRTVDLRSKRSVDQLDLLREISTRIKILEKRITVQEQTAVPREYLKHILQKVMNQYNLKTSTQPMTRDTSTPPTKMRNSGTQYSSKSIPQRETKHQCGHKHYYNAEGYKGRNVHVNTCLHTQTNQCFVDTSNKPENVSKKIQPEEMHTVAPPGVSTATDLPKDKQQLKDLFWFWGEEIVRPGCDLRNKILNLLEDKIHKNNNGKIAENTNINNNENTFQYPAYYSKNSTKSNPAEIKIERDTNTIVLNNIEQISPYNTYEQVRQTYETPKCYLTKQESVIPTNNCKTEAQRITKNTPDDKDKREKLARVFPTNRSFTPKGNYRFDIKKTLDDSTFRKNIEACKEKFKEKPQPQVEEKYFNSYACHSISTESKASMEYISQKIKNCKIMESGLTREREEFINAKFMFPPYDAVPKSYIKEKLRTAAFRPKYGGPPNEKSINFTYVNPKIHNWSEESTQSEDRSHPSRPAAAIKKEVKSLEKKESLIYKLDFLKNLAKNKSIDQSRVLNRIWNQAKSSARSNKDAVLIKIPIKTINTCDANHNVVEMELTLEELETVVKTAKHPPKNQVPIKLGYRSSSEVDIGQRRHQEIKKTNREALNRGRRQTSARSKIQR